MTKIVIVLLLLSACQSAAVAPAAPQQTEEPGFTRFCQDHPGRGTCP